MSSLATEPRPGRASMPANRRGDDTLKVWLDRIDQAKRHRQTYEGDWLMNAAFAAGKHWLEYSERDRRLVMPARQKRRDRYTTDVLTQYIWQAIGELAAGTSDLPPLSFRRDDITSEEFAKVANDALDYGWEVDWEGDKAMFDLRLIVTVFGTGGLLCRFDPTLGPPRVQDVPYGPSGPILDPGEARAYVADLQAAGETAQLRSINEGRTRIDPLDPFNLLVPPGVARERDFPWEIVVGPRTLDSLTAEYGAKAEGVEAEQLTDAGMRSLDDPASGPGTGPDGPAGRLDGSALTYYCRERPSSKHQKGQSVVVAGGKLLERRDELPYQAPNGEWRTGILYFHWWRQPRRFWSRGIVAAGESMQKGLNETRTQQREIIARALPKVIVEEGAVRQKPVGLPLEVIELKPGSPKPLIDQGAGPGPWMQAEVQQIKDDLEQAVTIRRASLGENPTGVTNYSQLARLLEADQRKLDQIIDQWNDGLADLVESLMWDVRKYWPAEKLLSLEGDEGLAETQAFRKADLPDFFYVKRLRGGKPRSQAAELQKVTDLWSADKQQPAQMQRLTLEWLAGSIEAGRPLPLPDPPTDEQRDRARLENHRMVEGEDVAVAYFDPIAVHLPEHRHLQVEALNAGMLDLVGRVEQHILAHQQIAAAQIAQHAAVNAPPPGMPAPGQPAPAVGPEPPPAPSAPTE